MYVGVLEEAQFFGLTSVISELEKMTEVSDVFRMHTVYNADV